VLASRPRGSYVLSSKVGRILEPVGVVDGLDDQGFVVPATHRRRWDFSREGIRRSLEESLARLGLERLDIVYLHDPDEHWTDVLATGYAALEELRADGIVGAIGAGMNQSAMLADLVRETDVDVVMLAGRYTLLEQDALDDLLPLCRERGVAVVAAGVFNSGLLARECPRDDARYNYGDAPRRLVERAQSIARICGQHGTTLPAAALAFPLGHAAVASVCVGARSAAQMARNAALYHEPIASGLWSELKARGLLRSDAPVPA
jgi:D-threo-aldose 1-dehydrogenase